MAADLPGGSELSAMQQLKYQVRFVTPAFLGDADQNARWRTPPFKALLRQWWRVVWAAKDGNDPSDIKKMRREEGLLFGHAWLKEDRDASGKPVAARKSQLRIRLDRWNPGKLGKALKEPAKIEHPYGPRVGPLLYLGYGPLKLERGNTVLKGNAAIQQNEEACLSVAVPAEHSADIRRAIELISAYGAIGGRSRNGWGSMHLNPADSCGAEDFALEQYRHPWLQALETKWPFAVGSDDRGALVWRTKQGQEDWIGVMRELAKLKIDLRTQFKFGDRSRVRPDDRRWLAYPVTRHDVSDWKRKNLRLPNSLRFKVRREESGKLRGVIFHMPCLPPSDFKPDRTDIKKVWKRVHEHLDSKTGLLERIPE